MNAYAQGGGHKDLASRLKIDTAVDQTQSGCANNRIIRTTIKDSHHNESTLYVLGMTFVGRSEATILKVQDENNSFEGAWTNPQNQIYQDRWVDHWKQKDTDDFVNLKLKEEIMSVLDRTEDLMLRICAMIDSLKSRGHRVIVFQQADTSYHSLLDTPRLALFKKYPEFIDGFKWCAIQWQHSQGVAPLGDPNPSKYGKAPEEIQHRQPGQHKLLNDHLVQHLNSISI